MLNIAICYLYIFEMSTFLFNDIIFGPVWSRRLGESLGINLLPTGNKVCNFNCIYCECGLTPESGQSNSFPDAASVSVRLNEKLRNMSENGEYLNSITFAGNGEPTLHPDFPGIIRMAIQCRNQYFPEAKIAVLSNATTIRKKDIFEALLLADLNILKLDSAIKETVLQINCPKGDFNIEEMVEILELFKGKLVVQTLFLKGNRNGIAIDNTTEKEVSAWLKILKRIKPENVMLYSLARDTAVSNLQKVDEERLNSIARLVEEAGISTLVTP
jgi:wyosine [tRNA(Phe)-imidazoG37] synthetase (radical SAM superfamily)